ncbi:glycoside hydrolase family 25 protein [Kutzneria sp. NPDC052558]|uniref:glycoside hydrolase family 25 protein n=1 Tax=Kutzneria sp. NPDC052558 TaxID=3364121 RepID=UPI0037C59AD5
MADYGIDVSGYNTITNWSQVRAGGNAWTWAKATQGDYYTNPLFGGQFAGSSAAGLITGAYHFPDPGVSVAANVGHFVSVAAPLGSFGDGALLPMLDLEDSPADGIAWNAGNVNSFVPAFRDALRAATGQAKLCVYAPQSWWAGGMLRPNDWADADVYLCAARYGVAPGDVGWSHPRLAVHQYTNAAPTPGSARPTDRSVTVGAFDAAALTIGEDDEMAGFWFIGNADTGETALLYPNGDFVGVDGSNYSAVISANRIPKLDVPQNVWNDMVGRRKAELDYLGGVISGRQTQNSQ